MGCISSRILVEDTTRPTFHVWNINEDGQYIKSCHIRVTDTELILHQRGEPPIIWPLQSLRRYGFDTELFSFECGRHCATGPGIYAFKCKQAESLFNALQDCLLVPRSDSEVVGNGNGDDTDPQSSLADSASDPATALLIRDKHGSSPSSRGGKRVMPSAPAPTPILRSTPQRRRRGRLSPLSEFFSEKSIAGLPPLGSFNAGKKFLPRCCMIGTCINASKQHYMNNKVLSKTTCGSCRTCSLNMCVVQQGNASNMTYADRAKQTDYGNVLDNVGHPRNCVHCCCDFRPTQKGGCSADDCPLHFNNCVDQLTNYARLDRNNRKELAEKASQRREKLYQLQQPYSHLYTHIPTPVPKWPETKSMSWRSLPQFGGTSSLPRQEKDAKEDIQHETGGTEGGPEEDEDEDDISSVAKPSYLKQEEEEGKQDSDGSLAVLSSLSDISTKGSDPDMYAKIDYDEKNNEIPIDKDPKHRSKVSSAGTQT